MTFASWMPDPRIACVLAFAAALALGSPQRAHAAPAGIATYTITATATPGGTISPEGAIVVAQGADTSFTIQPSSCDTLTDVQVDGVSVGKVTSYTFTNVQANHTIEATFGILQYTITPTAGNGGTISPAAPTLLPCAADQKFDFTPAPCYRVEDVIVDGGSIGAVPTYTFSKITDDHTISVSFTLKTYTITASASSGGSVTSSGANVLDCGSSKTFTAIPDICHSITDIQVDSVSVGTGPSYTFNDIQADHTISVTFAADQYTIGASSGTGGTIVPEGNVSVDCAGSQQFTITPSDCYAIQDVLVDGVSVGSVPTYTISSVHANHSIVALFSLNTYTITASADADGAITPLGPSFIVCGADQSYSITPDSCFSIANISIDGLPVGATTLYTFTNVRANHTIHATFTSGFDMYSVANTGGSILPAGNLHADCHDNQSYTIAADGCDSLVDVKVDGLSVGPLTTYTFTNIQAAHTIQAVFVPLTNTIAVTQSAGGSITPSGNVLVNCGTDKTFTIAPDSCHTISDVTADGVSVGAVATYTFTNVTLDHTLTATFAIKNYTVTATAGANGSITPVGGNLVGCGADRAFAIAPDSCYHVAGVLVDGISVGAVTGYTFTSVTANHTIDASFAIDTYTITATAAPGVTVTPSGAVSVNCGANQAFAIAADSCHTIADVLIDGVSSGALTSHTFVDVHATHTIAVTAAVKSYAFTVSSGAGGTVTPNGAVSANCGDNQSFTIAPDACHHIADVLVDGVSAGTGTSYTFTNVQATHSIAASFTLDTYTITATAGAGGSISPSGATLVNCGTNHTFTVQPDTCHTLAGVDVDGVPVGAVTSYPFLNVSTNHTISATFTLNTYVIAASAGTGGTISPSGNVSVNCASDQSFTFTPAACFTVQDVVVDGGSLGAMTGYDFTDVTAAHTIAVTFVSTNVATTVAVTSDVSPSTLGQAVTFTATLTPSSATGTVTFADSLTALGTFAITAGTAQVTTSALAVGAHTQIKATYNPNACFTAATSAPYTQLVNPDPAPIVTVTFPNGGESWNLGESVNLAWTATDNGTIASVKLELSRNNGGTWETLAASVPNSGTYNWTVTGPGTNGGTDTTHVYSALFKVTATDDQTQDGTDTSNAAFALFDVTTAVVITQLDAETIDGGVSVKWAFVNRSLFASLELQRSQSDVGPWSAVSTDVRDDAGVTVAVDRSAEPGQSYFYRLVGTTSAGTQSVFGPIKGTAGAPKAFALSAVWPNPSRGDVTMQFSMPRAAQIRLSVVDLQGREVAVLANGEQKPGRYEVRWDGRTDRGPVPAGLYFVRFVTPDKKLVSRVAIAR